jgi:hypothetical protein
MEVVMSLVKWLASKLGGKGEPGTDRPRIAVMGQYKTGTTALFFKIKNSMPTPPRTLFEAARFVPQSEDARTGVLAKVMVQPGSIPQAVDYASFIDFERKIYITRDPRDRFVSDVLFAIQQNAEIYQNEKLFDRLIRLLEEKERNPSKVSLLTICSLMAEGTPDRSPECRREIIADLHQFLFSFEATLTKHLVVKYEEFVENRLGPIEEYLRLQLQAPPEVERHYPHVPRTCSSGDWRHWYLAEDVAFFKDAMQSYIERYGYSRSWDTESARFIAPAHCSEYVKRTVSLRLKTAQLKVAAR